MRILVTGVSGFAGSHISMESAKAGHEVIGLYRHDSHFLSRVKTAASVGLVQTDIASVGTLDGPFEAIVHTAATSPAPGITVSQIIQDNLAGMHNLLAAAVRWHCSRFVFFSSLSLYGDVNVPVLDESADIVNPDAYGASKYLCELMLAEQAKRLPSLSLRLPGVLGPNAHRNWLANAAAHIMEERPIRSFNLDGPYNNAVHVSDIADLVLRVLENTWTGADSVVLGARGTLPFRTVIERLATGLGHRVQIEPIVAPKPSFTLSSLRAMDKWGYSPMEIGLMIDRYASDVLAIRP